MHILYLAQMCCLYSLATLCLNGTLPCVDFMYVTMGDIPFECSLCVCASTNTAAQSQCGFVLVSVIRGGSRICGKGGGGAQRLPRAPQARRFLEGPV